MMTLKRSVRTVRELLLTQRGPDSEPSHVVLHCHEEYLHGREWLPDFSSQRRVIPEKGIPPTRGTLLIRYPDGQAVHWDPSLGRPRARPHKVTPDSWLNDPEAAKLAAMRKASAARAEAKRLANMFTEDDDVGGIH